MKFVLGVTIAVALVLAGCGRKENTVKQAKDAVRTAVAKTNATTGTANAHTPPTYIDSERYLPAQERLRRRQERIQAVLDKQPKPR